ncbi:MAG: hypothetical protein EBQ51_03300 [Verrucomicrobia bacterium]|nr:hypothetical protein [Pseudomonadota bacterium]NBS49917.1 hypothetical protein [Verrucomicrobiota bacterium]NBV96359.1 hypothetical protein [Verrucomicrobiota bacterium]NBY66088.1 hypothetical protein [Verrucomicrobiota bacterium]
MQIKRLPGRSPTLESLHFQIHHPFAPILFASGFRSRKPQHRCGWQKNPGIMFFSCRHVSVNSLSR